MTHHHQYKTLIADIEAQIAASTPADRPKLQEHLKTVKKKVVMGGFQTMHPGARAEQYRMDDEIEAQFDNVPV